MMVHHVKVLYILSLFLIFCKSSEACESNANSTVCSIKDARCQGKFLKNLRDTVGRTGSPELNLPPFEPYTVTDGSFTLLGLNITLVKGQAYGITKTCNGLYYKLDLESYQQIFLIICTNITIDGYYTITSSAIADNFLGASVNGDGCVNLVAENWYYKFVTPFNFEQRDDGEIYLNIMYDKSQYVSKILKNLKLCINGVSLNGHDISTFVNNFVNDNWKLINTPAADPFHRKAVDYFFKSYTQFFSEVPATTFFCDDLTPYIR